MGLVMIILVVPAFLVHTMASSWPEILKTVLPCLPSAALAHRFRISFSAGVSLAQILPQLPVVEHSAGLILPMAVSRMRRMDLQSRIPTPSPPSPPDSRYTPPGTPSAPPHPTPPPYPPPGLKSTDRVR